MNDDKLKTTKDNKTGGGQAGAKAAKKKAVPAIGNGNAKKSKSCKNKAVFEIKAGKEFCKACPEHFKQTIAKYANKKPVLTALKKANGYCGYKE